MSDRRRRKSSASGGGGGGLRSFSFAKQQAQLRRPICPFISSTFQDFQEERDILVKKVFPALDAVCRQRGTYCCPVDLRWGINNAQVSSGLVIQLCLDYIRQCAPYFICLLGERYGTCRAGAGSEPLPLHLDDLPDDADWMDRNLVVAGSAGYDWVLQEIYQDRSVTELEIIQAAFLEDGDFCRFYFRQPDHTEELFTDLPEDVRAEKLQIFEAESEYSNLKVRDLKARIVKKGLSVEYFRTPEELAFQVYQNWKAIVDQLYPPLLDVITENDKDRFAEWTAHETYAETRRRVFVKSPEIDDLFDRVTDFALSSLDEPPADFDYHAAPPPQQSMSFVDALRKKKPAAPVRYQSVLLLVGERGAGKTALAANWAAALAEQHPELTLFTHYMGASADSLDAARMMRRAVAELRPEVQASATPENLDEGGAGGMVAFRHVSEAFLAAVAQQPCVLLLDGVDEMGAACGLSPQQVKEMEWLPLPLPPQCKIVMTTLKSDTTYHHLHSRPDTRTIFVPGLKDPDHRKSIIHELLAVHCKCLGEAQLERIVTSRLAEKPIFLSILANELRVFGVYSRLDFHLEQYVDAASIRDLWSRIIQRWVKDYGWSAADPVTPRGGGGPSVTSGDSDDALDQNAGWVADALRLIAVSRHGLSQAEILALLPRLGYRGDSEVTGIDWAVFRCAAMDSLFEKPGGLLNFFHKHFKEAVEHTLLGSLIPEGSATIPELTEGRQGADRRTFHQHLADFFYEQAAASSRRNDELPWHLEKAGDLQRLGEVLTDANTFLSMLGERRGTLTAKKIDLLHFWSTLTEAGHDPSAAFINTFRQAIGEEEEEGAEDGREEDEEEGRRRVKIMFPEEEQEQEKEIILEPRPPKSVRRVESLLIESDLDSDTSTLSGGDDNNDDDDNEDPNGALPARPKTAFGPHRRRKVGRTETTLVKRSSVDSIVTVSSSTAPPEGSCGGGDEDGGRLSYIARLGNDIGFFLSALGHFSAAEQVLQQTYDRLNQAHPLEPEKQLLLVQTLEVLANMYYYLVRRGEARRWYHRALAAANSLYDELLDLQNKHMVAEIKGRILDHLGTMAAYDGLHQEAERLLHRAKRCMEFVGSVTGLAQVTFHMGILRSQEHEFVHAEAYLQQALETFEAWYGKCHPRVADVLNEMAGVLENDAYSGQDRRQAEALYRRALNIRETLLGPKHLLVASTLFHLGKLLKTEPRQQAKNEALVLLRRAMDIRTTNLGHEHHLTKDIHNVLSDLEIALRYRPGQHRDNRSAEFPGSALSWHEKDLINLHRRFKKSAAGTSMRSNYKYSNIGSGGRGSYQQSRPASGFTADGEGSVYSAATQPLGSGKNMSIIVVKRKKKAATEDGNEDGAVTATSPPGSSYRGGECSAQNGTRSVPVSPKRLTFNGTSMDDDSGAAAVRTTSSGNIEQTHVEVHTLNLKNREAQKIKKHLDKPYSQSNRDKGLDMLKKYYASRAVAPAPSTAESTSSTSRSERTTTAKTTPMSTARSTYYGQSTTTSTKKRPSTAMSTAHSLKCDVPSAHRITPGTVSMSMMRGPHTDLYSLLGRKPAPRAPPATHHTSAWYHVPGRYVTVTEPHPSKRSQKRVTKATMIVLGSPPATSPASGRSSVSGESSSKPTKLEYNEAFLDEMKRLLGGES